MTNAEFRLYVTLVKSFFLNQCITRNVHVWVCCLSSPCNFLFQSVMDTLLFVGIVALTCKRHMLYFFLKYEYFVIHHVEGRNQKKESTFKRGSQFITENEICCGPPISSFHTLCTNYCFGLARHCFSWQKLHCHG